MNCIKRYIALKRLKPLISEKAWGLMQGSEIDQIQFVRLKKIQYKIKNRIK